MAVIRINKTQNYTVMSNYHLKEKNMSLKAKGLLSLMLSLPDDWDYSVEGLASICKENKTAITTALAELRKFGYLKVTKLMPNKSKGRARIEYVYDVFEKPTQEVKKQDTENLYLENLHLENQPQLNTNILNTKKLNTKKERVERKTQNHFSPPTPEEVKKYCKERNSSIDPEHFFAYYESKGWQVGGSPMQNWKCAVIVWEKREAGKNKSKFVENETLKGNESEQTEMSIYDYNIFEDLEKFDFEEDTIT